MNFTINEAAVVLIATSKVMLLKGVCAMHATSNEFDEMRIKFMQEEGIDGERAEEMLEVDLISLTNFDPDFDKALAEVEAEEEEADPEDEFEPDEDRFLGGLHNGG